ncbi:MAG: TusE/DsrC/DsvC family sulfur relay protein [Wenzhouxiangella sp.]
MNDDVRLDEHGHLADPADWSRPLAERLAHLDGVCLDAPHWWLIDFVRDYHQRYGNPPLMRTLLAAWRDHVGDASAGSRDLYRLFSDNPVRQACRYGGLPKPDWCL